MNQDKKWNIQTDLNNFKIIHLLIKIMHHSTISNQYCKITKIYLFLIIIHELKISHMEERSTYTAISLWISMFYSFIDISIFIFQISLGPINNTPGESQEKFTENIFFREGGECFYQDRGRGKHKVNIKEKWILRGEAKFFLWYTKGM